MSEADFEALMTQKRSDTSMRGARYETRDEWADALRSLARYGADRSYVLDPDDVDLLRDISPESKRTPAGQ